MQNPCRPNGIIRRMKGKFNILSKFGKSLTQMNNYFLILFSLLLSNLPLFSDPVQSPSEFLGYPIGEQFTYHHHVLSYFEYIAANSPRVSLIPYGQTYEGRPLMVAVLTSEANHRRLEEIRQGHIAQTTGEKHQKNPEIPVVWLGYNIHGDEPSSTEVSMEVLYYLAEIDSTNFLDSMIVLIDPCENPDGRERYVSWFRQVQTFPSTAHTKAAEHQEIWPGGRENHYAFDLNRDWCWQTQRESQQRSEVFYQWRPHILVDFHEMKPPDAHYFFAPPARPFHQHLTSWQKEFYQLIGEEHKKQADKGGWLYFTGETYDLLYPSYGDSWPAYQGSISFTYEQAGGDSAGLVVPLNNGRQLTLKERISHHYQTSFSTLEAARKHRKRITTEFQKYFRDNLKSPAGEYKSFIISRENPAGRVQQLLKLLDRNHIEYGLSENPGKFVKGFSYQTGGESTYTIQSGDIVISAFQPNSRLLQVLFEPETYLEDSLTYDLTAWAVPYAFDLKCFAIKEKVSIPEQNINPGTPATITSTEDTYALIIPWNSTHHVTFLGSLLKNNIVVRVNKKQVAFSGRRFERGSLIITRSDNPEKSALDTVTQMAARHRVQLYSTPTGRADDGVDLGSGSILPVSPKSIALIKGQGISSTSFGEIWHLFEREFEYPVIPIDTRYLAEVNLKQFDVVILPSGDYGNFQHQILDFATGGGKVIAMENALGIFTRVPDKYSSTLLSQSVQRESRNFTKNIIPPPVPLRRYEDSERNGLKSSAPGSIYRVSLDDSHPLCFGQDSLTFIIKRNTSSYPFLNGDSGWNAGIFRGNAQVSGFTGSNLKIRLEDSLCFGEEAYGKGHIIYFSDSPVIRGFWESGKLILANAVFFAGE